MESILFYSYVNNTLLKYYNSIFFQKEKIHQELYKQLPEEIKKIIFAYAGILSYHNGKYINHIEPTDNRYKMLLTIPKVKITPIKHTYNNIESIGYESCINYTNKKYQLILDTRFLDAFGCYRYVFFTFDSIKKYTWNTWFFGHRCNRVDYTYRD